MSELKTTVRLAAVLLFLIVLIVLSKAFEPKPDTSRYKVKGAIFPDLVVDELTRIEMKKGSDEVTLVRSDEDWTVEQEYGYKADKAKMEELLEALRRYNDAEIYSDKPELHADFNCTEDTGVTVKLYSGDKVVGHYIAGKAAFTSSMGYIRKVGDNRVLEVYGNPARIYNPRPAAWIKTRLFDFKADDISSIHVKGPGGEEYTIKRDENKWTFEVVEEGKEPNTNYCNQIAWYLSTLSFKDVVQKGDEKLVEKGLDPPVWSFEINTSAGNLFTLAIGNKKDNASYYARANESPFVVTIRSNVTEMLMSPKENVVTGRPPEKVTENKPKKPHRTKYKVEGKGEPLPLVKIVTNKGEMVVELWEDDAPNTVANFIYLVEKGFYNGLTFHRHEPNTVLQGGDPKGNGTGGPGWRIEAEVNDRKYDFGVMGMADSGVDTAGSQFFFAYRRMPMWDGRYTCFGRIIKGQDVFRKLEKGDSIVRMEVIRKRNHEYRPWVYKEGSDKEERLPPLEKNGRKKEGAKKPGEPEKGGESASSPAPQGGGK